MQDHEIKMADFVEIYGGMERAKPIPCTAVEFSVGLIGDASSNIHRSILMSSSDRKIKSTNFTKEGSQIHPRLSIMCLDYFFFIIISYLISHFR